MEQVIESKFSCAGCGKIFRWKPEIAGKKAKCKCGASVTVPENPPGAGKPAPKTVMITAAPPKRTVPVSTVAKKGFPQPVIRKTIVVPPAAPVKPVTAPTVPKLAPAEQPSDSDQGEYDIADGDISQLGSLLPSAEAIAAAERELPPILAAQAAVPAEPLEYQRPEKTARANRSHRINAETGELDDPIRDWIAPAILLAAGVGGVAAYIMLKAGTGPLVELAISIALAVMLGITLVKTVILIMAAVPLATYCDVNVGLLRTAILKIAGTILFGDTAIMWVVVLLQSAGLLDRKSSGGILLLPVYWVLLALIYHVCFWHMFRLPTFDIRFAALMMICSRIIDFLLAVMAIGFIISMLASHAVATASPFIPARLAPINISPNAPLIAQAGQTGPTMMDQLVSEEIKRNPNRFQEGYAWCRLGLADNADKKLVSDMYAAGADKVYMGGFTMYAQLPSDPAKRSACLAVASAFRKSNGIPESTANLNYQYAVINLAAERLKAPNHGN